MEMRFLYFGGLFFLLKMEAPKSDEKTHLGAFVFVQPVKEGKNDGPMEKVWSCCFAREENAQGCVAMTVPEGRRCTRCGQFGKTSAKKRNFIGF